MRSGIAEALPCAHPLCSNLLAYDGHYRHTVYWNIIYGIRNVAQHCCFRQWELLWLRKHRDIPLSNLNLVETTQVRVNLWLDGRLGQSSVFS